MRSAVSFYMFALNRIGRLTNVAKALNLKVWNLMGIVILGTIFCVFANFFI